MAFSIFRYKKYVDRLLRPYLYLTLLILILASTIIFLTLKNRLAQNAYSVPMTQDRCITKSQCQFHESCVAQHCQHNEEWAKEITPVEALAIYQLLKTDLGIDIPFILDEERVDKLQDAGVILAASNNPCALNSYVMLITTPGINHAGSCYSMRALNKDYREATDKLTLKVILEGMYPDLDESEVAELEELLKQISYTKAPKAVLEQYLFVFDMTDLFITDPRDVFRGAASIFTKAKKVKLLPQLLSSVGKEGKYYLSRKGMGDLLAIARNRGADYVDYASQFAPRLRHNWRNRAAKILRLDNNEIKLWRSYDVLSPEDDRSFRLLYADANRILREKVGRDYDYLPDAWPYFSDRFDLITPDYQDTLAVYIYPQEVMIINIDFLDSKLISETVHSGIHEKLHYLMKRTGLVDTIRTARNPYSYVCGYSKYCASFEEGMVDLLARSVMQKAGAGWQAYGSYQEQVESVIELVNYSQDADVLFASIREGSFRPLLSRIYKVVNGKYVPWTIEDLKYWIEGITPISKVRYHLGSLLGIKQAQALTTDYLPLQSLNYYPQIEENEVNEAAYNLASELSRGMEERDLNEISLDIDSLNLFMLAAASLDQEGITLEFLEEFASELEEYEIVEVEEEEIEEAELVEIGKGPNPLFKNPPVPTVIFPSVTPFLSPRLSPSTIMSPTPEQSGSFPNSGSR